MATSPSHKLGELIGDFFEFAIIAYLAPIVQQEGYYLDYRHPRPARGNQREVIGIDHEGNKHKLDIVVEEGGSEYTLGVPRAFIEMAWRRYKSTRKTKFRKSPEPSAHWWRLTQEKCLFTQPFWPVNSPAILSFS